jgi:hypothetical protein
MLPSQPSAIIGAAVVMRNHDSSFLDEVPPFS